MSAWHFITLPKDSGKEIALLSESSKKAFGSVRVQAKIADCIWSTSVFPDNKAGSYILPVKKGVRKQTKTKAGDRVTVTIDLLSI